MQLQAEFAVIVWQAIVIILLVALAWAIWRMTQPRTLKVLRVRRGMILLLKMELYFDDGRRMELVRDAYRGFDDYTLVRCGKSLPASEDNDSLVGRVRELFIAAVGPVQGEVVVSAINRLRAGAPTFEICLIYTTRDGQTSTPVMLEELREYFSSKGPSALGSGWRLGRPRVGFDRRPQRNERRVNPPPIGYRYR